MTLTDSPITVEPYRPGLATMQQPEATWDESPGMVHAVRRYWWLLLIGLLVGVAAGYLLSRLQPTLFTATAEILLSSPSRRGVLGDELDAVDPTRNVLNQAERMMSTPVLAEAAASLPAADVDAVRGAVFVEGSVETDIVTVSATHPDPQLAADIANAVTRAYEETLREEALAAAARSTQELEEARDDLQERLNRLQRRLADDPNNNVLQGQADGLISQILTLDSRIEQINVNASLLGAGVQYVEPAVAPTFPSQPRPRRTAAAGGVLGLVIASVGASVLDRRRRSAERRMDPAATLRAPLLGSVPDLTASPGGDLPTVDAPRSAAAEAYQMVVMAVLASLPPHPTGHTILVTSAQPGEGKTVTALNLAAAAHHGERDVLLVDGDTRMRGLSRRLSLTGAWGLAELHDAVDSLVWWEYRHAPAAAAGLEVVPVGAEIADPAGFFRSERFSKILQRMRDHADIVFIDSPPLLAVSDTLAMARDVDGVVVVVNQGTPLDVLEEVRRRLDFVDTPLLGYVFNRADTAADPYGPYAYDLPREASGPEKEPRQ